MSSKKQFRILAIGAHPDDCDFKAGGTAILYSQLGHHVRFVSVTNGDAGHHELTGETLAQRRAEEAKKAGQVAGIEYITLKNHDGELEPTLENRRELIRLIRQYKPDIIFTHRPNDYHPDHRYTSILVQDSAYMVTVPNICPDTPYLEYNPVIVYFMDHFRKPAPFQASVAVGIDDVLRTKIDMLHCHKSQMYEWLPYNKGREDELPPAGEKERKIWLKRKYADDWKAEPYRDILIEFYGEERGNQFKYAEAFEPGEYGSPLNENNIKMLFPFRNSMEKETASLPEKEMQVVK